MDFDLNRDDEAFRREVQEFIAANLPPESERGPDFLRTWHDKLAEKRWIGFHWPAEVGGGGGSVIQQFILKEEMSNAEAPELGSDFMGLAWVGPALIEHGSPAQQEKFLPDLLACRSAWCTGYSEPDSGSDLASISCRARREGSDYVITGSKIWTTAAHYAQYIFLLVRTSTGESSRHTGASVLLVPMDTPGIEIRPIPNLNGVHSFNQVFFNDVRVSVDSRLGAEGEGWRVVMGALANERSGISESTEKERHLERLKDLARNSVRNGRPALEDAGLRRELARYETLISAMRLNGLRALSDQLRGEKASTETTINKLLRGQLEIPMWDCAMGLLGHTASDDGSWQRGALNFHGTVIGGGSPNIQRNIIAERALGLPKDR